VCSNIIIITPGKKIAKQEQEVQQNTIQREFESESSPEFVWFSIPNHSEREENKK
jgi:hypothetical protein